MRNGEVRIELQRPPERTFRLVEVPRFEGEARLGVECGGDLRRGTKPQ
jgi:hypothetical protein